MSRIRRNRKDFGFRRGEGRIREGRSIGTPPYGYRVVRRLTGDGEIDRGLREIAPDKAAIVRRIFADYAAGLGPLRIARTLNQQGIPGPGGGIWYDATIRGRAERNDGILRNPTYTGQLVWSRRHAVKDPVTGTRIRRTGDPADIVVRDVPHLRIIDQNIWERVQARLATEAAPVARPAESATHAFWERRRPRHLLSGKVVCGLCHRPFSARGQDYLGCRTATNGACRNTATIRRGPLQTSVLQALGRQLMHPALVAAFTEAYAEACRAIAAEAATQADTRHRQRAAIERKLTHLVDAVTEGQSRPSLLQRIDTLEAELARIPTEAAVARQTAPPLSPGIAEAYQRKITDMQIALTNGTDPEALETARQLIDRIIITPPEIDGDPSNIELVGDLKAMLTTANPPKPKESRQTDTSALDRFISSVKEAPGAKPLALLAYTIKPPARAGRAGS